MSFEFFISGRYIKTKQRQAFISLITILSVAGVAVGVMALIIVIAVMAGFESTLKHRILGADAHVLVMRHGGPFEDYEKVVNQIRNIKGVEAAAPFVYTQAMIRSSNGISGAVIRGVQPEWAGKVVTRLKEDALKRIVKSPGDTDEVPKVILGKELSDKLGVLKGDPVYLISPRGMVSPIGHMPVMKRFETADLFESGMYEYDATLAFIHITDAQRMLRIGDSVTGIEIRVKNIMNSDKISRAITKELGFPFWARDWREMNHNLFSALKLEKTVMFIILSLIILVAAFNIASSLIMMVMEKTKDIAILKAMGATNRSIRRIFVLKGMVIGGIGTFIGVCLGSLMCVLLKEYQFIKLDQKVYIMSELPVQLEFFDVGVIALAAVLICFLATLYPAHQASKLNPVEAFRYG